MSIAGITEYTSTDNCALFLIDHISDEFKECVRKSLQGLFWGATEVADLDYTYQETLNAFLRRYDNKDENMRKGMIGELIINIIINHYITCFDTVSVLRNLEEENIKKGFDIIYYRTKDGTIWYAEVKAGEKDVNNNTSAMQTKILCNRAYTDIRDKLTSNRVSLWDSALVQAKLMIEDCDDLKQIRKLLKKDRTEIDVGNLTRKCVILSTSLFADMGDSVDYATIQKLLSTNVDKGEFDELYVVSIQKNTYSAIVSFLKSEIT